MTRLPQKKVQSSLQSSTSRPSIARRRGGGGSTSTHLFGRGRKGKNLKQFACMVVAPPTPRELDEDSGLGTEASLDTDTCHHHNGSAVRSVGSATIAQTDAADFNTKTSCDTASGSAGFSSCTNTWLPSSSSSSTMLMVTSSSSDITKLSTNSSGSIGTASVNGKFGPVSSSSPRCTHTRGTLDSPVNLQFKQVKRRLNVATRPADAGATVIQVPFLQPLQPTDTDAQRPPAKKQATLKKKQSICVKRLAFPKTAQLSKLKQPLRGSSLLLQLSDEATQELPGEASSSCPVPQLLDFANLSAAGLTFAAKQGSSVSSAMPTFTSIVDFNLINSSLNFKENSVTSKSIENVNPANITRRILLPFLHEESSSFESSNDTIISKPNSTPSSPAKERTIYISNVGTSSQTDSKVSCSPVLSCDLTNLCGSLSLSQAKEMPTDFNACKTLFTSSQDEVSSKVDTPPISSEDVSSKMQISLVQDGIVSTVSDIAKVAVTKAVESEKTEDDRQETCNLDISGDSCPPFTLTAQHMCVSLTADLPNVSSDGKVKLVFIKQPEKQHRARYLTEGSRGAVKDQEGSGHPVIEVQGTSLPCVFQVFVGSDSGAVVPHAYYQACQVSSKTVNDIKERSIKGTTVIEVPVTPQMDMRLCCDCVGILKERYVDVEQRRGRHKPAAGNSRKASKCRMVFRVTIQRGDGATEMLQIASQPISCTQPPGIPEILRKSISSCRVAEEPEMFIIGKHFQKDSKVVFQQKENDLLDAQENDKVIWSKTVTPDVEVLHSTHLICKVPVYDHSPVLPGASAQVMVLVLSAGKYSEPHTFYYLPDEQPTSPIPSSNTPATNSTTSVDANNSLLPPLFWWQLQHDPPSRHRG